MDDKLKQIIYWVGMGAGLIVYAHANFSTVGQVEKIEKKVDAQVTKQDFYRLEDKFEDLEDFIRSKK